MIRVEGLRKTFETRAETVFAIKDVGFDDVLCMARPESIDDLAQLRDAL